MPRFIVDIDLGEPVEWRPMTDDITSILRDLANQMDASDPERDGPKYPLGIHEMEVTGQQHELKNAAGVTVGWARVHT